MRLEARFGLTRGAFSLDLDLEVDDGATVALVGPNGAGKSTTLKALAGLLRIDRGRIAADGVVWDGGAGGAFVPPHARGVGMVFQDALLFPRLSVIDNVAYGPRSRGTSRREARRIAATWLERVGVVGQDDALPSALSGGQAQRVALARALAPSPRVLLLDEPLAAVDASAKVRLRHELRLHLRDFRGVRVAVVHDIGDALALADRLTVLEDGRIVQQGAAADLVRRPASRYVADLVGLNCFRGVCHDGIVDLGSARLVVVSSEEGPVVVTFHPRAVSLFRHAPQGSPRNVWTASVHSLEPSLDRVRVQLEGPLPAVAEITPQSVTDLALTPGTPVWAAVKASEITVAKE